MYEPTRMCFICRKKALKKELTRYFMPKSNIYQLGKTQRTKNFKALLPDLSNTAGGRGYYLCDNCSCQEKFQKLQNQKSKKV